MTWNTTIGLRGAWSIRKGFNYILTEHSMEAFWPLEYFPNEAVLNGNWLAVSVPDTGSRILLLAGTLLSMLYIAQGKPTKN
jgi:hypothetical protein